MKARLKRIPILKLVISSICFHRQSVLKQWKLILKHMNDKSKSLNKDTTNNRELYGSTSNGGYFNISAPILSSL